MAYGDNPNRLNQPSDYVQQMTVDTLRSVRNVSQTAKRNWKRIWTNGSFTPAQMWAVVGVGAIRLLKDAEDAEDIVNSRVLQGDPDYILLGIPDGTPIYAQLGVTSTFTVSPDPQGIPAAVTAAIIANPSMAADTKELLQAILAGDPTTAPDPTKYGTVIVTETPATPSV